MSAVEIADDTVTGLHGPCVGQNDTQSISKQEMYETFHTWALQNYGDSGKTKTVTRKKHDRILRILSGEEISTAENSKFRFWVKAKGFLLGSLDSNHVDAKERRVLFVPSKSNSGGNERGFKKVAVVEDFFDIIYDVHVEMDGRGGKHAGQKRTYRAIAETYSFLPREAVTRFLMSCGDCQKRMHLSTEGNNNISHVTDDPPIIDFALPITQTYLNHMRSKGFNNDFQFEDEESISSGDSDLSRERTPTPPVEESTDHRSPGKSRDDASVEAAPNPAAISAAPTSPSELRSALSTKTDEDDRPLNMSAKSSPGPRNDDRGHPERKRRASDELSYDSSTKAPSEYGVGDDDFQGCKDDDDDDENDDDDKAPDGHTYDPERLKSFNMFVRLFVDENLDRVVPISKQPKDKITAILEACDRQFPDFHIRSRKRIRTYLKSCRRMRRSKEQNGWEPLRPTPPHLTSAAAESLLAKACENESNNAKRMRMGLEPLAASAMRAVTPTPTSNNHAAPPSQPSAAPSQASPTQPAQTPNTPIERHTPVGNDFIRHQPPPPAAFRPPHEFPPFFANGNGFLRAGFPPSYQHPAHHHPPVIQHTPLTHNAVQNGPTDLSMKKSNSKSQLSPSEVNTIKQLIAGYRESAAFLYRSADELEQLLLQQN